MSSLDTGLNEKVKSSNNAEKVRMELYDWLQCLVIAIISGILIFIFIGRPIGVEGRSMHQTLRHDDRVVISNIFYTPDNGDIIVFQSPSELFEYPLVKRVIAVAGQTVDIDFDEGNVYIDDVVIPEPYLTTVTSERYNFVEPVTVPDGFVFVLGDNRNSSIDSRDNSVGLVDTRYILGKVLFVITPGVDEFGSRDWNRVGFVT